MKILFITDLYPIKAGESQTPLTLHNFVFEWIRQGNEVDVVKPNFLLNSFLRGKKFYPQGFYEYEGVQIFNANYFTPFLFDFTKKMPEKFDFDSYDMIVAHMPSGIIFANKLAKIFNKPLICAVHVSDIEVLTNPLYKFYFANQLVDAYKNSEKIACRSFAIEQKFNNLMPELAQKTFVAPSGVESIQVGEKENKPQSKTLRVLTCANLIKRKNVDKLILAVDNLEDFELTVIGDGKELNQLKKMQSQNIRFVGRLPRQKVLSQMQKSDIFVLPSVNETFGMVYLEAMASGCITVCTKNDGVDGIIKDAENGFLCEPTVESIKETLLKIRNFENIEKIVENSLATVREYTQENCAQNYLKMMK